MNRIMDEHISLFDESLLRGVFFATTCPERSEGKQSFLTMMGDCFAKIPRNDDREVHSLSHFVRPRTSASSLFALALLIMASLACGNSTATRTPEPKKIVPTLARKAAQPTYALGLPMITSGNSGTSGCLSPAGWSLIRIKAGDTLESLAQAYHATVEALIQANCLPSDNLIPGTILYVPGIPPTESSIQCGPPADWIYYTVQPGDTLHRIGKNYSVSVAELQFANCMGDSTLLRAGVRILVPNVQTRTPTAAPTH